MNGSYNNVTEISVFALGNTTGNSTILDLPEEKYSLITKIIFNIIILPVTVLIGIFGNLSTAILFVQNKSKNASIVLIIGLAVSDLLVLICRLITDIYTIGHLYFTEAIRFVRPNSFVWILFSNTPQRSGNLFILTIVIERFTAVWFPLKHKGVWTTQRACLISVVIILLTLGDLVTVLDALLFSLNEMIPEDGVVSTQAEAGRYIRYQGKFIGTWSSTYRLLFDVLPLPLVFVFNVVIIIGIKRMSLSAHSSTAKSQQRKDKEARITRMLLVISVLFVMLCSPFNVYVNLVVNGIILGTDVPLPVYETIKMLSVLNSVVNFITYGVNDTSLRKKYFQLWGCGDRLGIE